MQVFYQFAPSKLVSLPFEVHTLARYSGTHSKGWQALTGNYHRSRKGRGLVFCKCSSGLTVGEQWLMGYNTVASGHPPI